MLFCYRKTDTMQKIQLIPYMGWLSWVLKPRDTGTPWNAICTVTGWFMEEIKSYLVVALLAPSELHSILSRPLPLPLWLQYRCQGKFRVLSFLPFAISQADFFFSGNCFLSISLKSNEGWFPPKVTPKLSSLQLRLQGLFKHCMWPVESYYNSGKGFFQWCECMQRQEEKSEGDKSTILFYLSRLWVLNLLKDEHSLKIRIH